MQVAPRGIFRGQNHIPFFSYNFRKIGMSAVVPYKLYLNDWYWNL